MRKSTASLYIFGFITVLVLIFGFMTYFTVDQNEEAVVTDFGHFSYVAGPGLHFKMPFVNATQFYRTDIQSMTTPSGKAVNTYTSDNQEVDVIFTLFYRVPPDKVEYLYANNRDYVERLYSLTIDRLKAGMGQVNVQTVAENRGKVRDTIKAILEQDAKPMGVEVTDFQLTDIEYTKQFREANDRVSVQKAQVESRKYEQEQIKTEAQTAAIKAEGEANAVRAKARGDADAALLRATAEAKAIQLKGEAQAASIKAQADALKANGTLVDYKKAEQWDGKLPQTMLSNVMPFMNVDQSLQPQQRADR